MERVIRWLILQIRKPLYKLYYGRRILIGRRGKVSLSTSIRVVDRKGTVSLGDSINFRPGVEVFAVENGRLTIGDNVFLNRGVVIGSAESVTIKNGVTIGPYSCIYDHNHSHDSNKQFETSPIVIEENVWIGANVTILKGVHIGKNAIIGAGTVVCHDIPENCTCFDKRTNIFINTKASEITP